MFVLTGDIHHKTLGTRDQTLLKSGESELFLCRKYLDIVNEYGVSPTIFVSGRVAIEEKDLLYQVSTDHSWEVGGHTYNCYTPKILYGISRRLLRRANGPYWLQYWDNRQTIKALEAVTGGSITSWRNHAYREDINTKAIAVQTGLCALSNGYCPGHNPTVREILGRKLLDAPINALPDHENLSHANPHQGYDIAAWANRVYEEVLINEERGIPSVILAHPACMEIEDGMKTFHNLVRKLSSFKSLTLRELASDVLEAGKK